MQPGRNKGDSEFMVAMQQAGRWTEVRVSDSDAPEWFARVLELRTKPTLRRQYKALMARAFKEELALRQRLKSLDWTQVQAEALAILVEGFFSLRTGVDRFLPQLYCDWPAHVRRAFYVDWWVLAAITSGVEPILPVREIIVTAHLGGAALEEIPRRAEKHAGFIAGAFPLMAQAGDDPLPLIRRVLRKMARKHTPPKMREDREFVEMADDAISMVLGKRLGDLDPFEAAVAGLEGKWDIIPRAIGDVLKKDWHRHLRDRRDIEFKFEDLNPTGHLRDAGKAEGPFEPKDKQRPSPEEMAHLLGLIEADPDVRLAWEFEASGKTQEQFAKERGISTKTLSRRRKKVKTLKDKS